MECSLSEKVFQSGIRKRESTHLGLMLRLPANKELGIVKNIEAI